MLDHISPRRLRLAAEMRLHPVRQSESSFQFHNSRLNRMIGTRSSFVAGRWGQMKRGHPTWIITRDEQRCDVRLPLAYPIEPPDRRRTTPLWHPNIGLGGECGWKNRPAELDPNAGLEVVAECLWMSRGWRLPMLSRAVNIPGPRLALLAGFAFAN